MRAPWNSSALQSPKFLHHKSHVQQFVFEVNYIFKNVCQYPLTYSISIYAYSRIHFSLVKNPHNTCLHNFLITVCYTICMYKKYTYTLAVLHSVYELLEISLQVHKRENFVGSDFRIVNFHNLAQNCVKKPQYWPNQK